MQYMLLIYESPEAFDARTGKDQEAFWGAWRSYEPLLRLAAERRQEALGMGQDVELDFDERLKLMFVYAHSAIDAGAWTPLMLQTVLGLDAVRIASAFLVAPD